jgi:hypothetical protein
MAIIAVLSIVACGGGNNDPCTCPNGTHHIGENCCSDSGCTCTSWQVTEGILTPAMKTIIVNAISDLTPAQQTYVKKNITEIKIIPGVENVSRVSNVLTITGNVLRADIRLVLRDFCEENNIALMKQPDTTKEAVRITTRKYIMEIV